ncbi:MAG: hypothetical protein ACK53Y_02800, partial [bacterium]
MKNKPTLSTPTIIIPLQINGAHWAALLCHKIKGQIEIFYADDMNSKSTETMIRKKFSSSQSSTIFYPANTIWTTCLSSLSCTYMPHSNKCGPRTLLAASVIAFSRNPNTYTLLPCMHNNLS